MTERALPSGDDVRGILKPPQPPLATLTWGESSVNLSAPEFFHLRDCFGAHGFQPDTENCALCAALAHRFGWFDG